MFLKDLKKVSEIKNALQHFLLPLVSYRKLFYTLLWCHLNFSACNLAQHGDKRESIERELLKVLQLAVLTPYVKNKRGQLMSRQREFFFSENFFLPSSLPFFFSLFDMEKFFHVCQRCSCSSSIKCPAAFVNFTLCFLLLGLKVYKWSEHESLNVCLVSLVSLDDVAKQLTCHSNHLIFEIVFQNSSRQGNQDILRFCMVVLHAHNHLPLMS